MSDNQSLIEKTRYLASQAKESGKPYYHHEQIGFNYQLSNIDAGIGLGQLETLNERIEKKRSIFNYYKKNLRHLPGLGFQEEPAGVVSNRWLTVLKVDPEQTGGVTRDTIYQALSVENIESRYVWKPLHTQPVFRKYSIYGGIISEHLFNQGLCIPSGVGLNEEELNRVVNVIKKCFEL